MNLEEYLKMGGSIKLPYKSGMTDWYHDISLSYSDGKPFFQNLNISKYRVNLTEKESVYLFLSIYKHWNNLGYVITRLQEKKILKPKFYLEEDINLSNPSEEIKKLFDDEIEEIKKEWGKEFSTKILKSFLKPSLKKPLNNLKTELKNNVPSEYYNILTKYMMDMYNLGFDSSIYINFAKKGKGEYCNDILNNKFCKEKIDNLIETYDYDKININVIIDKKYFKLKNI